MQKIRMRTDIYRWYTFDSEPWSEISLKKDKSYVVHRKKSTGVYVVQDECNRMQLVIVPYEGRVYWEEPK